MGVISLGVFMTLELGNVDNAVAFYAFEFAHILIFFTALIFVLQVSVNEPFANGGRKVSDCRPGLKTMPQFCDSTHDYGHIPC